MARTTEAKFSLLLSEHAGLEELFGKHQRALLSKDVDTALATLATFNSRMNRHIGYEEEVLLPLYAAKGKETTGGTLPIFQAEHRKLREAAAKLARHTEALQTSSDILGSIIALLDEEAMFKGLFNHHSQREESLLFPQLDACTTDAERKRALRRHIV
jgi:hemerythrin-like domain-containing protein